MLERLRSLCDKDVDPKVLAEYIVVLAQMNKGQAAVEPALHRCFFDGFWYKIFPDSENLG